MTNSIDSTGIHTDDLNTIIARRTSEKQGIYGVDINVGSNTPDGQQININAQAERDLLDFGVEVFNSFDPDKSVGVCLDRCCAYNGVIRNGGTFTITPINITVDRALTLEGLDDDYDDESATGFTVSDSSGQNWILITSYSFLAAGTQTLDFRAENIGEILSTPNTITNQTTIVVGVTAVNNPSAYSTLGTNEETDAELRLRRTESLSLPSQGIADAIQANLLNLADVTQARVYENNTDGTVDTMAPHSIWAIVEGGAAADIADVIYKGKNPGCNMNGEEYYDVTRPQGDTFRVYYDRPDAENLYIRFYLHDKGTGGSYDSDYVKNTLAATLNYNIGDQADSAMITEELISIVPGFVPYSVEVSNDESTWLVVLDPTLLKNYFSVSAGNITIEV